MTIAFSPEILSEASQSEAANRRAVSRWLAFTALLVFALVLVGGMTRLTDSGLSITEWKPIHGVIPPLNEAEWQEEFEKYKQIPEYSQVNSGMDIAGFKRIFWWEWAHRFIARLVGVAFALPLAFFWLTGRLESALKPRLLGLLALGGLQGALGWWMVASGLTERVDVSQYRLAAHLTLASLIFAAIIHVMRGLAVYSEREAREGTRRFAGIIVLLLLLQIYLGGIVAGLDAGLSYNTWPLMDGSFIPGDLFAIDPAWRNFFENPKMAQFIHRIGAYLIFIMVFLHMALTMAREPGTTHARRSIVLWLLVTMQAALGVAALLTQAHPHAAITHQAMALIVLAFAVAHWRAAKGAYPMRTRIEGI
jgi:cytochrome c oxidase assembly protein subunit 15